jgi:hypothetical protein
MGLMAKKQGCYVHDENNDYCVACNKTPPRSEKASHSPRLKEINQPTEILFQWGYDRSVQMEKTMAVEILRRYNLFPQLVEALEGYKSLIESDYETPRGISSSMADEYKKVCELLRQAKGDGNESR